MVLFYLTRDETHTPDSIAAYSMKNGYYVEGTGTSWALMEDVPKLYGIKVSSISRAANNMKAVLDNGGIIICAMGKGDFTISGHYIIIYGYDNEGFMVNDPNCVARSGRRWTFSEIENQIARLKIRLKVFGYMIGRNHSPYASVCFFPGRPGGLIREIAWKGNIGRKAKNFRGVFTFLRKEKGFRSISNRVSFPPGEIRKISADISRKNCPWGS